MSQTLANLMQQSMEDTNIEVLSVHTVENPTAYCQYMNVLKPYFLKRSCETFHTVGQLSGEPEVETATFNVRFLEQQRYKEINEYFFFHGTQESSVRSILSQNLDFRLGRSGGLFGKAVYLAESALKSHQYTSGN